LNWREWVASNWRGWVASWAIGSALAFGYRGQWAWAALAVVCGLIPAILWFGGELAATRAMLTEGPAGPEGRHRRPPALAYNCSRCGSPGVTVWSSEEAEATGRRLGLDLVCDACLMASLRRVAVQQA
jgi:hypothetical protein